MNVLKKSYKLLIGMVIGIIITSTSVYAATVLLSSQVSYNNTDSGLNSTNVKDAIDELTTMTENTNSKNNIVIAYKYDESSCVTGDEITCEITTCYESKTSNSCPTGTIIRYRVNAKKIVTFYVLFDNGATMTMQQRENTISNIAWNSSGLNSGGPVTALEKLELTTTDWTNVNSQTYTMGTTVFETNSFTGCSTYNNCSSNTYTLTSRTAKARLITIQEAAAVGCTLAHNSCPKFMSVYLNGSHTGITSTKSYSYWTMNAYSPDTTSALYIGYAQYIGYGTGVVSSDIGAARAVVVILK